jgi:ADP-L-glycero-D-manno-heptose 6-epimerase
MAIVVTGASGFIASCLVEFLNQKGLTDLILVDDFGQEKKHNNLKDKQYTAKIDRDLFIHDIHRHSIEFIFHLGARTDTTEFNSEIFERLNLNYSKTLWNYATENQIPLLYASSAATYGGGEHGFNDEHSIEELTPLNPYGQSKQDFDLWATKQKNTPPFWVGLKFFNVFGPNEYHKGRMASVVMHAFNQVQTNGSLKLFKSHHPNYQDGEQMRDFIYVKDLLNLMWFWYQNQKDSGIYNAGSGEARTFNDLAKAIFSALNIEPKISYIPTPEDIRDKYQYYTKASMSKSSRAGYNIPFHSLEEAVKDYINHYLKNEANF